MQRNWIGKSVGAEIKFKVKDTDYDFTVFTTRCDTLFGATYCVLSPEHELIDKIVIMKLKQYKSDYSLCYENLKSFIESEEKQNEDLGSQITTLELRAELLEQAINACKANTEIEKAMTLVLDALGVFAQ